MRSRPRHAPAPKSLHLSFRSSQCAPPTPAAPLQLHPTFNPFLQTHPTYRSLIDQLLAYNHSLQANQSEYDPYEYAVYDRLVWLLGVLAGMVSRQVMEAKLADIGEWFQEQQARLGSRRGRGGVGQGSIKEMQKERKVQDKTGDKSISEQVQQEKLPFQMKHRTLHKQLPCPEQSLHNYRRRSLNPDPLTPAPIPAPQLILYPKIAPISYQKYSLDESTLADLPIPQTLNPEQQLGLDRKQSDLVQLQTQVDNSAAEQEIGIPEGQSPEEPGLGDEQQEEEQDKLGPRLKSYVHGPRYATLEERTILQRMDQRHVGRQGELVRKNREDRQLVELMDEWACRRSSIEKSIQQKMERMSLDYGRYSLVHQQPKKQEVFPRQWDSRYGFTQPVKKASKMGNIVDFSLPQLNHGNQKPFERTLKRDKLRTLLKNYGKMLNIDEYQQRDAANSLCQVEPRRRGLSQVLRKHSRSKERLNQIEEVSQLKERLAASKATIDVSTLSRSLCLPQEEESVAAGQFPSRDLVQNPFWTEPKKKKKRK